MRRFVLAAFVSLALCASAGAQITLIDEDFSDISEWDDLTTAVSWAHSPDSGILQSGGTVTLTSDARDHAGYSSTDDLKTFTALDYQFSSPVDRTTGDKTITVDFSAMWESGTPGGEGSRIVVTLTHDYPSGGLDMTTDERVDDFTYNGGAAWARPAYNYRNRPDQGGSEDAMMMFGGGHDADGEFEKYGSDWWLAGFSSGPDGHSPQPDTFGVAGAGEGIYSQSDYIDYRWELTPTHQNFYYDSNDDGDFDDTGELLGSQDITGDASNPGYYQSPNDGQWYRSDFPTIEGIRVYWRGSDSDCQAIFDSLSVSYVPEPATLAMLGLGGLAALLRRRR
jgi:hypothetical protein